MATKNTSTRPASPLTQMNAFAMQHGVILGFILIVLLGTMLAGLTSSTASLISTILIVVYPIIVGRLTFKYRSIVASTKRFSFFKGFGHAYFSMVYASIWAAIATYCYMQFFDNGHFINTLFSAVSDPHTQELLKANNLWYISPTHSGPTILDNVREMQHSTSHLFRNDSLCKPSARACFLADYWALCHAQLPYFVTTRTLS